MWCQICFAITETWFLKTLFNLNHLIIPDCKRSTSWLLASPHSWSIIHSSSPSSSFNSSTSPFRDWSQQRKVEINYWPSHSFLHWCQIKNKYATNYSPGKEKHLHAVSFKYNSGIYFRHFLKHQPWTRIYKRFQLFKTVEGAVVKCSRVILGNNRSKRIEDFCCDVDRPQGKDKVDHFCGSLRFRFTV